MEDHLSLYRKDGKASIHIGTLNVTVFLILEGVKRGQCQQSRHVCLHKNLSPRCSRFLGPSNSTVDSSQWDWGLLETYTFFIYKQQNSVMLKTSNKQRLFIEPDRTDYIDGRHETNETGIKLTNN